MWVETTVEWKGLKCYINWMNIEYFGYYSVEKLFGGNFNASCDF